MRICNNGGGGRGASADVSPPPPQHSPVYDVDANGDLVLMYHERNTRLPQDIVVVWCASIISQSFSQQAVRLVFHSLSVRTE